MNKEKCHYFDIKILLFLLKEITLSYLKLAGQLLNKQLYFISFLKGVTNLKYYLFICRCLLLIDWEDCHPKVRCNNKLITTIINTSAPDSCMTNIMIHFILETNPGELNNTFFPHKNKFPYNYSLNYWFVSEILLLGINIIFKKSKNIRGKQIIFLYFDISFNCWILFPVQS